MRTYLFFNQASGRFDKRHIDLIISRLKKTGLNPEICPVTTPAESLACCRGINHAGGRPLVIIAAGDGTINAVLNGLAAGTTTVAILPLGTSNVLAAELGIRSIDDGLERIIAGRTGQLSLGEIEMDGNRLRFALMAGIGFDGRVVRDVNPALKKQLRQGAYGISALAGAFDWDHDMLEVRASGQALQCHSLIVCNAARYGGNFVIAPESSLHQPGFTVICVNASRRSAYARLAFALFTGRGQDSSEVISLQAGEIEVSGIKAIQLDGDYVGESPVRIRPVADFAKIII